MDKSHITFDNFERTKSSLGSDDQEGEAAGGESPSSVSSSSRESTATSKLEARCSELDGTEMFDHYGRRIWISPRTTPGCLQSTSSSKKSSSSRSSQDCTSQLEELSSSESSTLQSSKRWRLGSTGIVEEERQEDEQAQSLTAPPPSSSTSWLAREKDSFSESTIRERDEEKILAELEEIQEKIRNLNKL